jgi:DNA polymerase III subunit beta
MASSSGDNGRASVVCGRSRYDLRALPPDEFPSQYDTDDGAVEFDMPAASLRGLIESTRYAVGTDEARVYLAGVFLHVDGASLIAAATDSLRLARRSCPLPDGAGAMPAVIVPTAAVRQMADMLADADGAVSLAVSPNRIGLSMRDLTFSSVLIAGTYPDYARFIPPAEQAAFTVKPKVLAEAVDRAFVVYAGTDIKAPSAKLTAGAKGVDLAAGDARFDQGTEDVDATVHDRGASFKVNARFLAEMLKVWPDMDVDIQQPIGSGPVLFTSKDAPEQTHLIMPLN